MDTLAFNSEFECVRDRMAQSPLNETTVLFVMNLEYIPNAIISMIVTFFQV